MIPLVLLAGFLGAGKTRFLTELVPALAANGTRVRVVLNDFRDARIDASRLAEMEALVTPLNGECVCCGSLRELLNVLYQVPPESGSVMCIEANGATETDELLAHLTADARLRHYTLPLQLTVIDATRWQKRWWHNALERAQVSTATHVFLNWTQRVSAERQALVRGALQELNPRAELVSSAAFADWLNALTTRVAATTHREVAGVAAAARTDVAHGRHAHPFGAASLMLPAVVERDAFRRFVQELPPAVVRAKGLVRFADAPGNMYVWNKLPGRKGLRLDLSRPHADAQPTGVFIGVGMPVAELAERLAALGPPGATIPAQ
ncbi:GTP-binding protein [Gemmatimonas aurantiaca]|uniref:CobW family GTP-binding protein n=1 Tax=Gemmatimonas aurantiaca TaxID=173480 RepID=UPI00301D0B00